jgi:four helix bundle protein
LIFSLALAHALALTPSEIACGTVTGQFDHEKLKVYQEAISFVGWCEGILQRCPDKAAVKDQLDRASTSIPLNIAEGNGKWSSRDRCRFLEIARGSAVECVACLDVLVAKHRLTAADIEPGKKQLYAIVSMLCGLIEAVANRIREEDALYQIEQEKVEETRE